MKTPIPHHDSLQPTGKQPIILFALSLIFALSILLPTKSLAQEKEAYIVVNGTKMTYYYNENKPTNALPIENYNEWPEGLRETITTAEIDQSLKDYTTLNSCAYWFYNFKNLTEITNLKYLNTENVEDMSNMFASCSKLKSLDLSNFKTAKVKSMYWMFCRCDDLERIEIGDGWNTGNVINMSGLFNGCSKLNFDLHRLNTSKVEDMSYMLNSWTKTTVFDLSEFDTQNVKNMQGMFAGCSKLEKIIIDKNKFNTSRVKDMSYMFYGCAALYDIDFSIIKTTSVEDMRLMFAECKGFKVLDLHEIDIQIVTNIYGMFKDCINLQTIDLRNFRTQDVTDMRGMFAGCENLTTILVSNDWDLSHLSTNFDDPEAFASGDHTPIFSGCINLIGNNGTKYTNANPNYTQYHQDINYVKVDDGYFTKDSYKIFYDLDGDGNIDNNLLSSYQWEEDTGTPETSFSLEKSEEIKIPNPTTYNGKTFKGWRRTPITDSNEPKPYITIPADEIGNRIYTAVWE